MTATVQFPSRAGKRCILTLVLCCLVCALPACGGKGVSGSKGADYNFQMTPPASWTSLTDNLPADKSKAALEARRQKGERVLIAEAIGPASARNMQPMIGVFLVNQDGTFMPREYAEKLQPEELAALGKDLLKREKVAARQAKQKSGLLDVQIGRESVDGKLAMTQRMMVAGPDGKPVRLINWDIYLEDGAGVAVKTVCDPESPTAEAEVISTVKSIRIGK